NGFDVLAQLDGGQLHLQLGHVDHVLTEAGDIAGELAGASWHLGCGGRTTARCQARAPGVARSTLATGAIYYRRLISHPLNTPSASATPKVNPGRVLIQVLSSSSASPSCFFASAPASANRCSSSEAVLPTVSLSARPIPSDGVGLKNDSI